MRGRDTGRRWGRWLAAVSVVCLLASQVFPVSIQVRKQQARTQFDNAERMRVELNGMPRQERTRREYQRVTDAYRSVYYTSPTSSKADASVVAVAELLAESGRAFNDAASLRAAIAQYEFLRREYPGSKYRFSALFTIGQIYKDDLQESDKARETFQEVIHRYPHLQLAADAREAINEMDQPGQGKQKAPDGHAAEAAPQEMRHQDAKSQDPRAQDTKLQDAKIQDAKDAKQDAKPQDVKPQELPAEAPHGGLPLVTGIRHWSTPDYTRVAIDLEQEVKYEAGRIPNPDRIFFDLHDTKLASTLAGKSYDVSDSFLRRVRVAQFQRNMVRVVLEVDAVSDYSAFLLPNPSRLIIDIHGRKPNAPQTLVARAQQAEEKRAPVVPQEPSQASKLETAKSVSADALSPAVRIAPAAPPASGIDGGGKADAEFGPRMADGSFFSPAASLATAPAAESVATQPATAEAVASGAPQKSTRSEVAYLDGIEQKATDKPTTAPTVQVVAPRGSEKTAAGAGKKNSRDAEFRQAQPAADGQRSLIRALGLKVGRIVIDAGHGGHDTGTIGPGGLLEKDLVLDVSLRLGRLLQSRMGAEVIYTRDDDTFVPLETRTAIANQQQADLFISIHANSSPDPSARGVETYYLNFNPSPDALEVAARENAVSEKSVHELGDLVKKIALKEKVEESREFATDVQHSLYQGLVGKEKNMRDRGVKKAPFIVLIGANMPSILAEISFVSNPGDERKLETPEYRQKIAESLYHGIARYINGLSGVKMAASKTAGEDQ